MERSIPQPTNDEINRALERVIACPQLGGANRQQSMLRFLVGEWLGGRADSLKETIVAIEVFGRDGSFDPRSDSIVRVEARKLRENLAKYYSREGSEDAVIISIPKGGYQPRFSLRVALVTAMPPAGKAPWRGRIWIASSVTAAILVAGALLWQTLASGRPEAANPAHPGTIAVLPFADLDPGKENEYLADALTDQVIAELSHLEGVSVVARTSTSQFRNKSADVRTIGKSLNAAFVMEGSVARSNGQVRATAQFIQTRDGLHLWSHTYQLQSENLFELQTSIARDILQTVRAKRGATDEIALASRYPTNGQAYEHLLRGLYAYDRNSQEGLEQSLREYQEALRLDPAYAPALAGISLAYGGLGIYGMWKPDAAFPRAREAAERALKLDPGLADAHAMIGYVSAVYDWNWTRAREEFLKSVELNSSCAHCHAWYALFTLALLGEATEAYRQMDKCLEVDPLDVRFQSFRIMVPVLARDISRAIEEGQRFTRQRDDDYFGHLYLSSALRQSGRLDEAIAEARRGVQLTNGAPVALRFLAEAYGAAGKFDEVRAIADDLARRAKTAYISPVVLASVRAALGDKEGAGRLLNQALDEHDPALVFLRPSGLYLTMKGTPVFDTVWRRIGLPD